MSEATARLRTAIAGNLKHARLVRGLSLRDLAERAGVSKGLLSQLEHSAANPTIEVLGAVAAALGLEVADLIRTPLFEPQVLSARSAEEASRTLFAGTEARRIALYETALPPGGTHDSAPHGRGSEEFAYVLSGAVVLTLEQRSVALRAGQAVRFSGEGEHSYRAAEDGPVELITLLAMPSD
ncbi:MULTISPECIES: XRE family transcriptional regulator [Kitasatospora]|uniref:Putative transcriptional regulator n=1 Tax=Kitasatospora setae (strain ATCC 33774 / DSM 43861 / JCM 3304 / KCC A-0304 / NBRC 14216 / KM-6054) TaxID=452652 RepID=E4N875_KITSK|nr:MULTISPECIES: XRE family transcriptional regulator [Kitasatospora]BAJ27406.1 putative transcriptional regulator [Kitasatospora setae KM-6054]